MSKTRITKEPETRKNEIIDAAGELFLTQGFDETSVSDIVAKVGVAQGLFYYYFKSKNEILDQVVDRFAEHLMENVYQIGNDDTLNSIQKLKTIFRMMLFPEPENRKIFVYLHAEKNERLHNRMAQRWMDGIITLFLNIIGRGVKEKLFDVEYPRETLEIMMGGFEPYFHSVYRKPYSSEQFIQRVQAGLAILEKTLGAAKGSLQITDSEVNGKYDE